MVSGILLGLALHIILARDVLKSPLSDLRVAVGNAPGSVAIADFNGDGKLDIVTANEQSGDASVLLNDGKGGFLPAPGSPFPAGRGPNDIAVGDFNRDGWLDLAFANHETQHLTVLLGDGRGRFAPAPHSPFAVAVRPHPHGIATGDFNGDGNLDLVTDSWAEDRLENSPSSTADRSGQDGLTILLGDGHGGFTTMRGSPFVTAKRPNMVAIGDVSGDGVADVVVSHPDSDSVTIFMMSRKGSVTSRSTLSVPGHPKGLAIRDLNGDGKADIVITNSAVNTVTVILGK
jgi:hypothetical protein